MPRDRLDGIKTKEGRVVYDRKKHAFTLKDAQRIIKKINARPGDVFPDEPVGIRDVIEFSIDNIKRFFEAGAEFVKNEFDATIMIDAGLQSIKEGSKLVTGIVQRLIDVYGLPDDIIEEE